MNIKVVETGRLKFKCYLKKKLFKRYIALAHFLRLYGLENVKGDAKFNLTHPNSICKVILRNTSLYGLRISAKSKFLVIDMKFMCKHIPKAGDKH